MKDTFALFAIGLATVALICFIVSFPLMRGRIPKNGYRNLRSRELITDSVRLAELRGVGRVFLWVGAVLLGLALVFGLLSLS